MFGEGTDMTKCKFLHNDDINTTAIPRVSSENSRAKNAYKPTFSSFLT